MNKVSDVAQAIVWPSDIVGQSVIIFLIILFLIWWTETIRQKIKIGRSARYADTMCSNEFWDQYSEYDEQDLDANSIRKLFDVNAEPDEDIVGFFVTCHSTAVKGLRIDAVVYAEQVSLRLTGSLQRLRSVLSVFIIIGLFGTLWGLAGAIQELSAPIAADSQTPLEIDLLIVGLRGAFAPSLWGVFLSIIGVFVIASLQHKVVQPFYSSFSTATLTRIAPTLFPEPSTVITATIKKSFDKAARLISVSDELGHAADRVEEQIVALDGMITNAGNQSEEYVNRLAALNNAFAGLETQLLKTGEEFHRLDNIGIKIESAAEGLEQVANVLSRNMSSQSHILEQHGELIDGFSSSLQSSNNVIESLRQTINNMKEALLSKLQEDEQKRKAERDQFAQSIAQPLQAALLVHLDKIDSSVADFSRGVGRVSEPLYSASKSMETIAVQMQENFRKSMERLHGEFSKQTEVRVELATSVNALNAILEQMIQNDTIQKSDVARSKYRWKFWRRG